MKICLLTVIVLEFICTSQSFPSNSNVGNSIIKSVSRPQEHLRVQVQEYQWNTFDGKPTKLIAHRGEKVLLPEHTLPGYETASILGADFVEPDLCLTKDDQFVCHHDLYLKDGTDVEDHPEFDHLKKNMSDGSYNWYIRDFTLLQLKTLKIRQQKTGIRPQDFNLYFNIPTFQEYLNLIHRMTHTLNQTIGIIPELKNPTFHNQNQSDNFMEMLLLEILSNNGYPVNTVEAGNCKAEVDGQIHEIKCPPVVIQCFEFESLKYLKGQTDLDLLLLVEEEATLLTPHGIQEASQVVKYYGVWKEYLYVPVDIELAFNNYTWDPQTIANLGGFVPPQQFPVLVHEHGMRIIIYTIHDSREPSTRGCALVPGCQPEDKPGELGYFFKLGVDGIFIENVAESSAILKKFKCDEANKDSSGDKSRSSDSKGSVASVSAIACLVTGYWCTRSESVYETQG